MGQAQATSASFSSVAGLMVGKVRPSVGATNLPSSSSWVWRILGTLTDLARAPKAIWGSALETICDNSISFLLSQLFLVPIFPRAPIPKFTWMPLIGRRSARRPCVIGRCNVGRRQELGGAAWSISFRATYFALRRMNRAQQCVSALLPRVYSFCTLVGVLFFFELFYSFRFWR